MAYGPSLPDMLRQAAILSITSCKGQAKHLPVRRQKSSELAVNVETANALGLTFPHPSCRGRI
jgi:hypothetical protein